MWHAALVTGQYCKVPIKGLFSIDSDNMEEDGGMDKQYKMYLSTQYNIP